jgi:hypothetical protein
MEGSDGEEEVKEEEQEGQEEEVASARLAVVPARVHNAGAPGRDAAFGPLERHHAQ